MKKSNPKTDSQQRSGAVPMTRCRAAAAETVWKTANEQRQVAKLIFRRAKEQAKLAKAHWVKVRKALAEAKDNLVKSRVRGVDRKPVEATAKAVAGQAVPAPARKPVAARKRPSFPTWPRFSVLAVPGVAWVGSGSVA